MTLIFSCVGQSLMRVDTDVIAANSQNFLTAHFDLDEVWENLAVTACFTYKNKSYHIPVYDGECTVPWEVIKVGEFRVSLIGIEGEEDGSINRATSTEVRVRIEAGPEIDNVSNTKEPTPLVVEQLTSAVNEAVNTAASVREDANSGKFDGADGKSAYQIAVDNGFEGTEEEWLESLGGVDENAVNEIIKAYLEDNEITGEVDPEEIKKIVEDYIAENLPDAGVDAAEVQKIIEDYLKANPPVVVETDPTVAAWAKAENKPAYTPEEVGADPAGTAADIVNRHNNATTSHSIMRKQIKDLDDNKADKTEIPTLSDLGGITPASVESMVSAHNANGEAHNDLRLALSELNNRLNAIADSEDVDLNQLSEIVAYIKSNKTLIDAITTNKVSVTDIVNNLTTNVSNKPLSAAQGVALKVLIDALTTGKLDASKLTEAINTALAQAKASGEFDGADGYTPEIGDNGNWFINGVDTGITALGTVISGVRINEAGHLIVYFSDGSNFDAGRAKGDSGYTPVKGVDYYTDDDKAEFSAYIATELAKRGQLKPEFANDISECIDTTKLYVLPDGHIYAYMSKSVDEEIVFSLPETPNGCYKTSDNSLTAITAAYSTEKIYIKEYTDLVVTTRNGATYYAIAFFDSNNNLLSDISVVNNLTLQTYTLDLTDNKYANAHYCVVSWAKSSSVDISNFSCVAQKNGTVTEFMSTGHAFVPADYEDRIIYLENEVADIKKNGTATNGTNPFNDKKIGWIGDSITWGMTPTNPVDENDRRSFCNMTASALGMTIINKGVSGSTIARTTANTGNNPMSERYTALDADCDVIVVSGGTNDFGKAIEIGSVNDTVNTTFYGAMKILCEGLISRYPQNLIVFTTPIKRSDKSTNTNGKTLKEYVDIIKEICSLYSIPVLDLWAECGLNPQLSAQSGYFSDGLHPTDTGHEIIARRVIGYFKQLQ